MKKAFTFLGFIICFSISALSQAGFRPGFIITNEGDTIQGKVAYLDETLLLRTCQFIEEGASMATNYSPGEIFGYGFTGDKYFVSKEVTVFTPAHVRRSDSGDRHIAESTVQERVFLEWIVQGAANLYKYNPIVFFAGKNGEFFQLYAEERESVIKATSYALDIKRYVGVLQIIMGDCPELREGINRVVLRELSLTDLFLDYSQCRGVHAKTFKEIRQKTQYAFMLKGGVRVSWFSFNAALRDSRIFDRGTFGYPASPHILGLLSFSNKRLGENFSFEVGLSWSHYKMADSLSYQVGVFHHFQRVDVKYHEIGIPIGINYSFIRPKVTPYLGTGVMFIYNANSSFDWKWEQVSGDNYTLHEKPDNLIKTLQFGGYINGGLEWAVFNEKASLLTELGFHFTNGIIGRSSYGDLPPRLQGVTRSNKLAGQVLVGLKF